MALSLVLTVRKVKGSPIVIEMTPVSPNVDRIRFEAPTIEAAFEHAQKLAEALDSPEPTS